MKSGAATATSGCDRIGASAAAGSVFGTCPPLRMSEAASYGQPTGTTRSCAPMRSSSACRAR